jgi:transcriptional regulator with XRE-family HTH domain
MPSQVRRREQARARGRAATAQLLAELRAARLDRNLSGRLVADALGITTGQYSRLERGLTRGLTVEQATVALDAVGLDLSVRAYPGRSPLRDAAHASLIGRLRDRCHPSVRVLTEVPLPGDRDQRAWDVVLIGQDWRHHGEVETRPRDRQALERRVGLKTRDGSAGGVSLVLLDSRHCRDFVRAAGDALTSRFPIPSSVALAALRVGHDPGPGSILLL